MRMECNEVLEEEANREGCSDRTVLSIGDFKPSSETSPLLLPPDLDSASAATSAPEPTCGAAATARRLPCLCSSSSLLASTKPRMLLGLATASILLSLAWLSGWTLGFMPPRNRSQRPSSPQPSSTYEFPLDFVWGAATSSYQIEGAASEGGRGSTVWDDFCAQHPSPILDQSSGEVACDHYHRMDSDVDLLASLHFRAYRFSIAWSRILPHGTGSTNPEGIAFYHRLIDALLARNITPWVTMHHWDLPSALPGGWRNRSTIDAFEEYSSVLFDEYGDKIRHWITINEPWTIAVNGYGTGVHAPGHISDTEPYIVGHHLLLAHGTAVREFRRRYGMGRDGHSIGIANCGDYRYPHNVNSLDDREASERAMLFQWGWFVDPIAFGDYPTVMRERLGDRLPRFTSSERNLVLGSASFLGLNYYSSLLASPPETPPTYSGYWADMDANLTADSAWSHNDMGWSVVPDGLREMLMWISRRYGDSRIFVTENGSAEPEPNVAVAVADNRRIDYFRSHLRACAEARNIHKVDLGGYFAWSFLDNFEWQFGYQRRFGICRVDFDTQQRTPKGSAWFLRDVIDSNGRNLATPDEGTTSGRQRQRRALSLDEPPALESRRPLPNRVVVGYGSDAAAVAKAVRNGVNVVIWSFLDFRSTPLGGSTVESGAVHERRDRLAGTVRPVLKTNLNLTAVRATIEELDATGYNDTVHLFSVGGWNGPHLDPTLSSIEWYHAFKDTVGHLFHGIDWDLEGNDDLDSPYNIFTLECLDKIGAISQMAKSGT